MANELIGMGQVRELLGGLNVTTEWLEKHAKILPVGVFGNNCALYEKKRIERFVRYFKQGVDDAAFYAHPREPKFRAFRTPELSQRVQRIDVFAPAIAQAAQYISAEFRPLIGKHVLLRDLEAYEALVQDALRGFAASVLSRFDDEGAE